ncbi:hypothetical protein FRB97_003463, partial [Tulasnella sp. 331]
MATYEELLQQSMHSPETSTHGFSSSPRISPGLGDNTGLENLQEPGDRTRDNNPTSTSKRKSSLGSGVDGAEDETSPVTEDRSAKRVRIMEDSPLQYVSAIATHRGLKAESTHELQRFAGENAIQRELTMYALLLKLSDSGLGGRAVVNWKPSSQLSKNARIYGLALMLSPSLFAYKTKAVQSLMDHMRTMAIPDMPIEEDQAKVKIFSSAVSLILSEIRANIKKK